MTVPALSGAAAAPTVAAAEGELADWTMMVYAVGDTSNVSQLMVENLSQLAELPEMPNVNVVVLIDLPERTDPGAPTSTLPGLGEFTTAKLVVLEGGRYQEIRDLGEVSMGRVDVLSSFIAEAADRFPAEKYGLTLFDHGAGSAGGYVDTGPPGTVGMTVPDIRNGMLAGMQQAGIDRFDVVYHAACLMSSYETASALGPLAESMAGSEEIMIQYPLSPQGFPPLGEDADGDQVGAAFIDGYRQLLDEFAAQGEGDYRDLAAMSVVDGDEIQALDAALESFSHVAVARMDEIFTQVARARADALEFVIGFPGLEGQSLNLVDLGDFLRALTDVPEEVAIARDAAFAALEEAVTHQVTGLATEQAEGLNVFLPTSEQGIGDYLTDGTAPPGWGRFVAAFLEASAGSQAQDEGVGFVTQDATVLQADPSGIKIAGQLTSGAEQRVVATETQVYSRLGDREQALAVVLPAYLNAGGVGQVQGVWDYSVTALTDGERVVPVTSAYQAQSGGLVGFFEAKYTSPEGNISDVGVRMLLSSEGEILSTTVADITNGTGAGIDLVVGGRLTPYIYVPSSGGFSRELSSQSIDVSNRLQVTFSRLPADTRFLMAVVAVDASGRGGAAFVEERVR